VLEISGGQVRLDIASPIGVKILGDELLEEGAVGDGSGVAADEEGRGGIR
jgi:sRNA-binding carbon storage regulator CsrA